MKRISKKTFHIKCNELKINANKSIFFKTNFFQKFGCNPFCYLYTAEIPLNAKNKLTINFTAFCKKHLYQLQNSSNILIHFRVNEDFPFFLIQKMMTTLQKSISEKTNVIIDFNYINNQNKQKVILFLET